MATIAEHEASMTIYYSKSTGEIKGLCTGIQDMSFYGVDAIDFSTIWAYVNLTKDNYVLENPSKFIMNLASGAPILSLKEINQYPVI